MTLTEFLATWGATVSTLLAYKQWASARPRLNIEPGNKADGLIFFDIHVFNDGDTAINITSFSKFRAARDRVKILPQGKTLRDVAEAVYDDMNRFRRPRFVTPRESFTFRVNIAESAPFFFAIMWWERPEWILPVKLPRPIFMTARRLCDIAGALKVAKAEQAGSGG